mmetsp:Transcript_15264/g.38471  ORF Transcript_15264/g.38471 Transcript_15264/m.38471 type:complete len:221 (-) Transcript_15264:905-1567(-)
MLCICCIIPEKSGGGAAAPAPPPSRLEKSIPGAAPGMPPAAPGMLPPMARCIWSIPRSACGFIICRTMLLAISGLSWNICRNMGFCASSIVRIASGLESTICCIICCIMGLSKIAIIWSGSMLGGIPGMPIPGIPGMPPPPIPAAMAPQGLAAAGAFALGVLDDDEAFVVLVDGVDAEGDPHGFGMAAPVDPSSVLELLLLLLLLAVVLPPPICASMRGS